MIYTDPIHDYTDYVIEELGLGENNGENNQETTIDYEN